MSNQLIAQCGIGAAAGGKGMSGAKGALSAFSQVAGLFAGGGPEPPQMQAPPPPPPPAPLPATPKVASDAELAASEAVVDTDAARIRALKRRKAAGENNLFELSQPTNSSITLSKTILGE